eukprot:6996224-Prymnesium_polylepis.1
MMAVSAKGGQGRGCVGCCILHPHSTACPQPKTTTSTPARAPSSIAGAPRPQMMALSAGKARDSRARV